MKRVFLSAVLLGVFLSAGCAPEAGTVAGRTSSTAAEPTLGNTSNAEATEPTQPIAAIVDWSDTVKFRGITYLATDGEAGGVRSPLKEKDLGPKFAEVKHRLQGNVNDPRYSIKNGDAGFLAAGTPVYEVKGYDPSFRLAAYNGKTLALYEVMFNPKARAASDYLDIEGKVRYIGVNSDFDGRTELASIRSSEKVRSLVEMIMEAPLQAEPGSFGDENAKVYFLAFHLKDGTASVQTYYADEGKMYFGITLPEEFQRTIERAVQD